MSRTLSILILSGMGLLTPVAASEKPAKEKPVAQPAVVRTWSELLASGPITLANGSKVRLGLETKQVSSWSGFLVYASLESSLYYPDNDLLGPLKVEITRILPPGEKRLKRIQATERGGPHVTFRYKNAKNIFFAKSLTVEEPGDYRLTFRDSKETVVAETVITVNEKAPHPWLAFGLPEKAREDEETKEGLCVKWVLQDHLVASPQCAGNRPLLRDDREISPKQPLPRWVFEKPDSRLQLKAGDGTLRLESKIDLTLSPEQFLFRMWVNDKPYSPKREEGLAGEKLLPAFSKGVQGKNLIIDWAFDAKLLQAKKGDRVAVQLLHCPDSWKAFGTSESFRPLPRDGKEEIMEITPREEWIEIPGMPLLSNKAEFVVP